MWKTCIQKAKEQSVNVVNHQGCRIKSESSEEGNQRCTSEAEGRERGETAKAC